MIHDMEERSFKELVPECLGGGGDEGGPEEKIE